MDTADMEGADLMGVASFKIEGMDKLKRDIEQLGNVPQSAVTASAKKGMNIALKSAKSKAPVDTGNLKKGIIMVAERPKARGRKIGGRKAYRVVFDRSMNDIFQKQAINSYQLRRFHGHARGARNEDPRFELKTSYYPVSQEYGYFTKNGRYIPGFKFGHKGLNENTGIISKTMADEMLKKIDKEIKKAGLK